MHKFTFFFILSLSVIIPNSFAQAPPEIEIIFDASRSMNESNGTQTRLQVAKQAVTTIAGKMTPGSLVGLRVFGNTPVRGNVKDSCVDSKLMIPIQPVNGSAMIAQVTALQAHGQTPIGYSLEQAAKDFTQAGDVKKTIILISDGEESCGKDPSSVVQALKAQGINIMIHTIGFDVGDVARGQLKRLAEQTGGSYADAQNAEELTTQLEQVAEKSMLLEIARSTEKNILAASEGTRIVASSTQEFAKMIDGKEEQAGAMYGGQEAVFSFKNGQGVLIKKFAVPIFQVASYNPGNMKLFGSVESPERGFFPLTEFQVKNKVYFGNVYQTFVIDPPRAIKFLKVVVGVGSTGHQSYHTEWRAYGDYLTDEDFAGYIQEDAKKPINLLAKEYGGQLIAASDVNFANLIDGIGGEAGNHVDVQPPKEGIFGFKNGKTALIEKVAVPIFEASSKNCKVIEFYASTTSPTSGYEKVGAFETMNLVFAGNPYQEYVFEQPVKAKFLKVKVTATHGMYYCHFYEVQAIGTFAE